MGQELLTLLHLNPSSFPDFYLATVVPVHAAAAIFAAVIACPIAIFARKGSRLHRLAGFGVVTCAAIVVISSLFIVVDSGVNQIVVNASVFPAGEYNQFYLVLLSIVFSYYCFSAARIWSRVPENKDLPIRSNWFDWFLALAGFAVALIYILGAVYTYSANNYIALVYLLAAVLLVPYTLFDIYTFIWPPRTRDVPWWAVHMSKMILVWLILIRFIMLRVFDFSAETFVSHQIEAMVIFFAICAAVYLYKRKDFQVSPARAP